MTGISSHGRGPHHVLALVLAGGRGERLQSLTDRQAKPALPFGGKFRMIDFPLSNCVNSGIRRIAVATQYRAHDLIHHVQRAWGFLRPEMSEFVELWPAQQQTAAAGWYAGTADAVYQNIELIRRHAPSYVLILAGDHVYKQDYRMMISDHLDRDAEVTISCIEVPREEGRRFGILHVDDGDAVTSFLEKPASPPGLPDDPDRCLASMGVYLFKTEVLIEALRADAKRVDSTHDFGKDVIPSLLKSRRLFAHRFSHSCVGANGFAAPYWRDVGTLDAYWESHLDLVCAPSPLDLYDPAWPIWTHQEQHAPARFLTGDDGQPGLVADSIVGPGSVVAGAIVRRSVVFRNSMIASGARIAESVVLPECEIGPGAHLQRCILAEGCRVPAGLIAGEDEDQDKNRFHRTSAGVTVITPRMLARLELQYQAANWKRSEPAERVRLAHSISEVA
jgi:glucose-1-phosphate adenylyltransferase